MKWLKRIARRFARQRGESIVETLAAVLICTFALLMLYTAIATAGRINTEADALSQQLYEQTFTAQAQVRDDGFTDYRMVTVEGFDEAYTVEYFEALPDGYASYRLV